MDYNFTSYLLIFILYVILNGCAFDTINNLLYRSQYDRKICDLNELTSQRGHNFLFLFNLRR